MTNTNPLLLTLSEVSEMTGLSLSTVRRAVDSGSLEVTRPSPRTVRVPRVAVDAWLSAKAITPLAPESESEPNPVPYPEGSEAVSVRLSPDKHGGYSYYEVGLYRVARRASDGVLVWRNERALNLPDRSSASAAAKAYRSSGYEYPLLSIRHGQVANP